MKKLVILILLLSVVGGYYYHRQPKALSANEVALLKQDIKDMYADFELGDPSTFLDKTYPPIFKLVGSREKLEKYMKPGLDKINASGITMKLDQIGTPSKLYRSGNQEITFVPKIITSTIQGHTVKSTGYLVAIRDKDKKEWTYLDGNGLAKHKNFLWTLFPELPRDIKLPPDHTDIL